MQARGGKGFGESQTRERIPVDEALGTRRRPGLACTLPLCDPLADELAKRRLVPERVEVGVLLRDVTKARPALDGNPKVTDRILVAAGQCLATGEVVERRGVPTRLQRLARAVDHCVV